MTHPIIMAKQTPDPKLIDSMAMRYRHDFGLLEEPQKESIRTTMKQLWEEVVGLGFYKDEQFGNSEQLAQQTAVEWLIDKLVEEEFLYIDDKPNHMIPLGNIIQQAKEIDKQQKKAAWDRGQYIGQSFPKGQIEPEYEQDAEEYYYATYKN